MANNPVANEVDKAIGPRLCDEIEAARFLNMSVEFLQADRARNRRIPFVKIGRAVRYDPGDLIRYKDECKVHGSGER